MRVLVLGGGWFVGRAVVEEATRRGWTVTMFNRGSQPAPHGVIHVIGDRESQEDLTRLAAQGPWEAVIDVAGAVPSVVSASARTLRAAAAQYVFVSTVSVYRHWPSQPVREDSPLHIGDPGADPGHRRWDARAYGPLKAGCEAAIRLEYPPDRVLVMRPGVVLGPHEYVGRLRWWLYRSRTGGQVLAPGHPGRTIQPVDVRDLASFVIEQTGQRSSGTFNVAAPIGRDTFGGLLRACLKATGGDADLAWVDEHWLAAQGVREWTELPLWRIPAGTWAMDSTRSVAAGLVCRPLEGTVAATWGWLNSGGRPVEHERDGEHGIAQSREAKLLAAAAVEGAIVCP
ncbi:NAD-dependent epimerase/dehydratase family protein [Micromonospora chokoriensis]